MENYEGMLSGVSEQFHSESDKYYGKLEESQQLFQKVISEKQSEIIKLRTSLNEKEAELKAKESELGNVVKNLQLQLEQKEKLLQQMVLPTEGTGPSETSQLQVDQTSSSNAELESLKRELAQKTAELESLKQKLEASDSSGVGLQVGGGSETGGGKRDYKFIKYKAQATAKIKSLEKQVEELQKVTYFAMHMLCICIVQVYFFSY